MDPNVFRPTLYCPGMMELDKLVGAANGEWQYTRRMVICLEDAVSDDDVPSAVVNVTKVLEQMVPESPTQVFIRARNPDMLKELLDLPHIERIAGFVTPKTDPKTFPHYTIPLEDYPNFDLMPILESPRMPDAHYRRDLLDVLSEFRAMIACLRIGGNDLMGHQGIRRDDYEYTIYDTVVGALISDIVNEFRGNGGFTMTAPVFECYGRTYDDLFRREVRRSIMNELFGQTVIHTRHMRTLTDMYMVHQDRLDSAQGILGSSAAVTGRDGKMDEKSTHTLWAQNIVARSELFGISD